MRLNKISYALLFNYYVSGNVYRSIGTFALSFVRHLTFACLRNNLLYLRMSLSKNDVLHVIPVSVFAGILFRTTHRIWYQPSSLLFEQRARNSVYNNSHVSFC
jgi:hypothetical protein